MKHLADGTKFDQKGDVITQHLMTHKDLSKYDVLIAVCMITKLPQTCQRLHQSANLLWTSRQPYPINAIYP